jgi:SAM-dependent methyltransferase
MQRVTEPELMDDEEQAKAYAEADFADANGRFMTLFEQRFPDFSGGLVLDLGCGPGDIPLRFARRYSEATVHGLDGSAAMLRYAQNALAHAPDLRTRVRFVQGVLPDAVLPRHQYDAIISNSLLHHLHRPDIVWRTLSDTGRPGGIVCIMDLRRPESEQRAHEIVEQYSGDEADVLKRDFFNSLLAAFAVEEVQDQLASAKLPLSAEVCGDRHLLVWGRLPG